MLQSEALSHPQMCRRMLIQQDPVLLIHSPIPSAPCSDDPNTCEGSLFVGTQNCMNKQLTTSPLGL